MNCVRALGIGLLSVGLLHALPVVAKVGVTWTVTGVGEPSTIGSANCVGTSCATLRDAINTAASGDTVTFDPAINGKTILLTLSSNDTGAGSVEFGSSSFLLVNKSLTIDGSGHGIAIARDPAQPAFRLFDINPLSALTLRGLDLRNGLAGGGSSNGGGGALGAGGAVFNQGVLTIDACTLAGNGAHGGAGGTGSSADSGGAGVGQDASGANGAGPNGGAAGLTGRSGGFGGGGGADDGNGGFGGGGAKGTSGGSAGGFGGGGGGNGGNVPSKGGFGGGHSGGGGGNLVPVGGGGAGMGGAIFNDAGTVTLTNATLYGNSATGGNASGGNYATAGGNGSGFGGAIFNYAGTLSLSFVTLSGNSTSAGTGGIGGSADGGAVYSYGDGSCGMNDGNACPSGGVAALTLVNDIAARSVGAVHDIVVDGSAGTSTSSGGGNLVVTQSGFSGTLASSADPQLGAPSPYGLAPPTLPIPKTSPAWNAAASCTNAKSQPVTTDERGVPRPQSGVCDIGAYESDGDYIFANGFD